MIVDTTRKTTIQVYTDCVAWVDSNVAGSSAADRWSNILKFYEERHGKSYLHAAMIDFMNSKSGREIIANRIREENGLH